MAIPLSITVQSVFSMGCSFVWHRWWVFLPARRSVASSLATASRAGGSSGHYHVPGGGLSEEAILWSHRVCAVQLLVAAAKDIMLMLIGGTPVPLRSLWADRGCTNAVALQSWERRLLAPSMM